eukprot:4932010-Amphidinium_carterae.1
MFVLCVPLVTLAVLPAASTASVKLLLGFGITPKRRRTEGQRFCPWCGKLHITEQKSVALRMFSSTSQSIQAVLLAGAGSSTGLCRAHPEHRHRSAC